MPVVPPSAPRVIALASAGTAAAMTGLVGAPPAAAVAGSLAVAALAAPVAGAWTLATLVPLVGLLPGGGPLAVVLAGGVAAATGWGASVVAQQRRTRRTEERRAPLQAAEQESRVLLATIRRYPALLEACQELGTARELDQFAEALCRHAQHLLPQAERVAVHLGSGGRLTCRAARGVAAGEPGEEGRFVATEARPLVRRHGEILRVLEPLRGDRRAEDPDHRPLRGVLEVNLRIADIGERLALEQLEALARLGGLGLAAVDLVVQARSLALRDDLTGLFGQHEFLRRLEELVSATRRHHHPLGLVMADMDHLKLLNDQHGHAAGDAALIAVAGVLQEAAATWPEAVVCRYGGEEFAIALPGASADDLSLWADGVRQAIAALPAPRPLSASFGTAVSRAEESARSLLGRADAACYRAKGLGRNRVERADGQGEAEPDSRVLPRVLTRITGTLS